MKKFEYEVGQQYKCLGDILEVVYVGTDICLKDTGYGLWLFNHRGEGEFHSYYAGETLSVPEKPKVTYDFTKVLTVHSKPERNALGYKFEWAETSQGLSYWMEMSERQDSGELTKEDLAVIQEFDRQYALWARHVEAFDPHGEAEGALATGGIVRGVGSVLGEIPEESTVSPEVYVAASELNQGHQKVIYDFTGVLDVDLEEDDIVGMFWWKPTPQGADYWSSVNDRQKSNELTKEDKDEIENIRSQYREYLKPKG